MFALSSDLYCAVVYAQEMVPDLSLWPCSWCGGGAEDEQSLLDHQEWCLGDGLANTQLLNEVALRNGELTQAALVAAAKKRRKLKS